MRFKIRDLEPLHSADISGRKPRLERLTDAQLLEACEKPIRGDRIKVSGTSNKVVDGNGRVHELRRRASIGNGQIKWDTELEVELYWPDVSMFR